MFDLPFFSLDGDRPMRWTIVRVGGRASHRFALRYVIYPAANRVRRARAKELTHKRVVQTVKRARKLWQARCKALINNQLWVPGESIALAGQAVTFRRLLHCRPSCVYFKGGNDNRIRPCNRHTFCPFCAARIAALFYRKTKARLNRLRKTADFRLHARTTQVFVPASTELLTGAAGPAEVWAGAKLLREHLLALKASCAKSHKRRQRNTVGSCWRIVAHPFGDGWNVELRELCLVPATKPPVWVAAHGEIVTHVTAALTDDVALQACLGQFVEYPVGMLTAYAELAAATLHACYAGRLSSGTGQLRTCSRGLQRAKFGDTDE